MADQDPNQDRHDRNVEVPWDSRSGNQGTRYCLAAPNVS